MTDSETQQLERLTGRQRRPTTGDIFRVRVVGGKYYFGLVVDGSMAIGPMAPGSILVVIFTGGSDTGELEDVSELLQRRLLTPPVIVNQRPWTLGYAEKLGSTDEQPDVKYVFDDVPFGKLVDRFGQEVPPGDYDLIGVWGLGNEGTLGDKIVAAL